MTPDDSPRRSVEVDESTTEESARRITFGRQVRDALTHLYDPVYLQTHPLARVVAPESGSRSPRVGEALRQIVLDAIESLHPLTGTGNALSSGAGYQILRLRYVEGLEVPAIQSKLALGKSEYYREQQRALDAVASLLWDGWHASQVRAPDNTPVTISEATARIAEQAPTPPRHNLPVPTTTYIARAEELPRVEQRLTECRLLTITGSGGCGKSRLALELARTVVGEFADGVWLVELAPLTDPTLVPRTLATAVGMSEAAGRPILETLTEYLRPRQVLLVLDNCEHLIAACAQLAETLLRSCARVRILATSRELLGVAGESTWRVPSLSVVDPRGLASDGDNLVSAVLAAEAGQLFVDRARLVAPSFAVTSENASALAQICRRLDGIPFAIELAAARVAVLTVDQIAGRLDQRFRLLTGGTRTALRRQQTLRATIDWSYHLLSGDEQILLRRLAVFAGGWSLEAAEAVCGDAGSRDSPDVFDLLTQLVAKSMVLVDEPDESDHDDARYRLLETTRQYVEEKLLDAGEADIVRTRHRDWYVALAERAAPSLRSGDQGYWLDRLDREHDNLRVALDWCEAEEVGADAELRLTGALGLFWFLRGHIREGRARLEHALQRPSSSMRLRGLALARAGGLERVGGDLRRARLVLDESATLARQLGDSWLSANVFRSLALVLNELGEGDLAYAACEGAVAASRASGSDSELALCLSVLGSLLTARADPMRALQVLHESLRLGRACGDQIPVANSLLLLGDLSITRGDFALARGYLDECLAIARALRLTFYIPAALFYLGDEARARGDLLAAASHWREGLAMARATGDRFSAGRLVTRYAGLLAARGHHRPAARLLGALTEWRASLGAPFARQVRSGYVSDVQTIRAALGDEEFAASWAEGKAMTLEEAVDVALATPELEYLD